MADTFGGVELPGEVTVPAGDPSLGHLGRFLQSVINAECGAAWAALHPRDPGGDPELELPVRAVYTHNPEEIWFAEATHPALYLWRTDWTPGDRADEWHEDTSRIRCLWALPIDAPIKTKLKHPIFNLVVQAVAHYLDLGIHEAWIDEDDADPLARDVAADPDALKLAFATSIVATTHSGAALDGVLGAATEYSPRLAPTVTTVVVAGAPVYNTTDPYEWTCINAFGDEVVRYATLTLPNGGETVGPLEDVKRVISVREPAHLLATGTQSFGFAAWPYGRGSDLNAISSFFESKLVRAERTILQIEILNGEGTVVQRLRFPALAMNLTAFEFVERDAAAQYADLEVEPAGLDLDVVNEGFTTRSEF